MTVNNLILVRILHENKKEYVCMCLHVCACVCVRLCVSACPSMEARGQPQMASANNSPPYVFVFILYFCVSVCTYILQHVLWRSVHTHILLQHVLWRSEDNFQWSVHSFNYIHPMGQPRFAILGNKHLFPLNHLTDPLSYFLKLDFSLNLEITDSAGVAVQEAPGIPHFCFHSLGNTGT